VDNRQISCVMILKGWWREVRGPARAPAPSAAAAARWCFDTCLVCCALVVGSTLAFAWLGRRGEGRTAFSLSPLPLSMSRYFDLLPEYATLWCIGAFPRVRFFFIQPVPALLPAAGKRACQNRKAGSRGFSVRTGHLMRALPPFPSSHPCRRRFFF